MTEMTDPDPATQLLAALGEECLVPLIAVSDGPLRQRGEYARQMLDRYCRIRRSPPVDSALHTSILELLDDIRQQSGTSFIAPASSDPSDLQKALSESLQALAIGAAKRNSPRTAGLWSRAAKLGGQLRAHIEQQQNAVAARAVSDAPPVGQQVQAYLRESVPGASNIRVLSLRELEGGRSKRTLMIEVDGYSNWQHIVLRQDVTNSMIDTASGSTSVVDEYLILRAAFKAGLAVAEPLWLEEKPSQVGAPFMISRCISGDAPGSWRGFDQPNSKDTRSAVRDLAIQLGMLHSMDVSAIDIPMEHCTVSARMQREIQYRWRRWQQDAITPCPVIDCAFERLNREFKRKLGGPALVHGDVLPHNLLFDRGTLSALLDWEFAHVGDPAEDLAYCRQAVSTVLPWKEFMEIYCASGGKVVSEYRLAVFGLFALLRNSALLANALKLYAEGIVRDFTTGAIAYCSLPVMENLIAEQIQNLDQLEGAAQDANF